MSVGGSFAPVVFRLRAEMPTTREVSQVPSVFLRMAPKELPVEPRGLEPPGSVFPRTGVGVRPGDAVEIAGEDQWLVSIRQRHAGPLGQRTARAFLGCPHGIEQPASVVNQFRSRSLVFFPILHVLRDGDLAANAFAFVLRRRYANQSH